MPNYFKYFAVNRTANEQREGMNHPIPEYVKARLRQAPPANSQVLEFSTPIVAFGRFLEARTATLGLNPSKSEFLDKNGAPLGDSDRRLETLDSLGATSFADLSEDNLEKIWQSCRNYFHHRPYRRWFDVLEKVLHYFNASYYRGTACHLDLVQWATDPVWGELPECIQQNLWEKDKYFLKQQVNRQNLDFLLLNGSAVIEGFESALSCPLSERVRIEEGRLSCKLYSTTLNGVKVIGWSTNLQSSWGVTNTFRAKIGQTAARLALSL